MKNEHDQWNVCKKILSKKKTNLFFKEGEIWWCSVGMNLGKEVYGKGGWFLRPVLILKKISKESCIIIPMTSKIKKGSWFCNICFSGKTVTGQLHQTRMISVLRLQERMATLSKKSFKKVREDFADFLGVSPKFHSNNFECGGCVPKVCSLYRPEFPRQEGGL